MFGLGFGISKFRNWGTGNNGPVGPTSTIYVDQVGGSDVNEGTDITAPLQTIGAIPLQDGMLIMLKRGSVWHEQLDTSANADIVIDVYGSGQIPVLDASDPVAGTWVVDGSFANVYNQTLTHEGDDGLYLSLWEDGVRPKWVASKTLCQATAGTFTVGLSSSGSNVFSVHPSDSGNPNSNGKLYEYSARNVGLFLGATCEVSYVRTRRQIHNNGSTIMGANGIANFCVFEDGVKHNLFASTGCVLNDCIAWKSDWIVRENHTSFVAFSPEIQFGEVTFNRCVSLIEVEILEDALDNDMGTTGFYAHTDGLDGHLWSTINFNQCSAKNNALGFSVADTVNVTSTRCHAEGVDGGFEFNGVTNNVVDPWVSESDGIKVNRGITSLAEGTLNIDGARIYTIIGGDGLFYDPGSGVLNLTNSVFYKDEDSNFQFLVRSTSTRVVNMSGCILFGNQGSADVNALTAPVPGAIDNNLYAGSINLDYEIGGNNYGNFATYRAAYPLLDVNSQAIAAGVDPGLVDPANGDFSLVPDSIASLQGVGLSRPDAVYTVIPTHAEVAAM